MSEVLFVVRVANKVFDCNRCVPARVVAALTVFAAVVSVVFFLVKRIVAAVHARLFQNKTTFAMYKSNIFFDAKERHDVVSRSSLSVAEELPVGVETPQFVAIGNTRKRVFRVVHFKKETNHKMRLKASLRRR